MLLPPLAPQAKRVLLEGRPPIAYDVLSVNVGITPAATAVPGALHFATPVKPIARWDRCSAARR